MVTNFWRILTEAIIDLITSGSFSHQFKDRFRKLFDAVIKDKQDPPLIVVGNRRVGTVKGETPGAAPDEVKDMLRQLIIDLVSQVFSGRPMLLKIILAFVKVIPDSFIDGLWDRLFAPKIAAGELPPSSTFAKPKKVTAAAPLVCSHKELLECAAEVGMLEVK
jgi:hypothetical protein